MKLVSREEQADQEHVRFSSDAAFSDETEGRARSCEPDLYRTEYQRDRDKILHTKAFRRLSHKTQVFLAPVGDHYRTRLTHTLEVAQIARTIARALGLNEDLAEAIALGHDLGHTPFGHVGEQALAACLARHKGSTPIRPKGRRSIATMFKVCVWSTSLKTMARGSILLPRCVMALCAIPEFSVQRRWKAASLPRPTVLHM